MKNGYSYKFVENDMVVQGEKHHLIDLVGCIREAEARGVVFDTVITDLIYQIEYDFDIDGIRSEDEEEF